MSATSTSADSRRDTPSFDFEEYATEEALEERDAGGCSNGSDGSSTDIDVDDGYDTIPHVLRQYDNWWVVNPDKSPVDGQDVTDVSSLLSFADARERRSGEQMLAFQFSETPFFGLDWDDVAEDRDPLVPDAFMETLHDEFPTYTEWSTSKTGLHQIGFGELHEDYGHRTDLSVGDDAHVEVYDENRYFVLTGDLHADWPSEVADCHDEIQALHVQEFEKRTATTEIEPNDSGVSPSAVRETLAEYAKVDHPLAEKAERALYLWDTRPAREDGDDSSERDAEFMAQMYFWCKGDTGLMDACWRMSSRMDEKASREDYRARTIDFVAGSIDDTFQSHYVVRDSSDDDGEDDTSSNYVA